MIRGSRAQQWSKAAWLAILGMGVIDLVWASRAQISFPHTGLYLGGVLLLLALAGICRLFGAAPGLARIAQAMAQFLAFLLVSETLSFLCATAGAPLQDARLAAIDRALGFDWPSWAAWVHSHRWADVVLSLAYMSYVPQFTLSIAYYAWFDTTRRTTELLWLLIIAFSLTMFAFALVPAAGPWVHYGVAPKLGSWPVRAFAALRSGALHAIDVVQVDGVVGFPSFHAAYAVFLTYIHRGNPRLLAAAGGLNGVMLLSLPAPGGHYLADILAGLIIAAVTILAWSRMQRRAGSEPLNLPAPRLRA